MAVHRMRTIIEARDYIRKEDPETAVTMNSIRTLCKEGIVTASTQAKRYLWIWIHFSNFYPAILKKVLDF